MGQNHLRTIGIGVLTASALALGLALAPVASAESKSDGHQVSRAAARGNVDEDEQRTSTGEFTVSQTVRGFGPSANYAFTVLCGPQDSEIGVPDVIEAAAVVAGAFRENIVLGNGESKTYPDLPADWVCSAEETDHQGALAIVIEDTTTPTDDGVVTIVEGATARVDFLNEFAEPAPIDADTEATTASANTYLAATTTNDVQVAGVVFSRTDELPATGATTVQLVALGLVLTTLGSVLVRRSRPRSAGQR